MATKPALASEVCIVKHSNKRLNAAKMHSQVKHIINRIEGGGRSQKGWTVKADTNGYQPDPDRDDGGYVYVVTLRLACRPARERSQQSIQNDLNNIMLITQSAGRSHGWALDQVDGQEPAAEHSSSIGYSSVEIPKDWPKSFDHIYDRDNQIAVVLSAIQAGIRTDWTDRFHVALVGPPASGKTEILRAAKKMVGEDCVLEYDATATTQAGAIKDLAMRDVLPRLLIIEEIEKADENSLRWLLGVLDHRAEIRKTNFKENFQKEVKMLGLATVNDFDYFKTILSGALASRFPYHIKCDRPNRALLERILTREVDRVGGKKSWIAATLDFAEEFKITDPRRVIAICVCGGDDFKSYHKKLAEVQA